MLRLILIILFICTAADSQAQLKRFRVEIPIPPEYKITDSIQSLTIMNRSMNSSFQNFDERLLQLDFYRKNFDTNSVILDSTASDTIIKSIADILFETQRFDVVVPINRNIYRLANFNETPQPLDWEYVETICETYNTDALLVLENLAIRAVTNYKTGHEFVGFSEYKYHTASMDFYSRAHWRVYYPKNQNIVLDIIVNYDPIYWGYSDYQIIDLFNALPTVKQAAIYTATQIAEKLAKSIAPKWVEKYRYYYVLKNPEIDQSVEFAAEGRWAEALDNWLKHANKGNRFERSKIMLNIALAYEMNGDIKNAIQWARKSQRNYYREVVQSYLKELLNRQEVLNK
jgi:hypothetical protein